MSPNTVQILIEKLKTISLNQKAWSDDPDFMVDDYAGGNIDDAYYGGVRDGEVLLARELLGIINSNENS